MKRDCYPDVFTDQHTRSTHGNCLWGAVVEAQKPYTQPTLCWVNFIINTSRMRGWVSLPLKLVTNHFLYWEMYLIQDEGIQFTSWNSVFYRTRGPICKSSLYPYRFSQYLSCLCDSHRSWNLCLRQSDSPGCNTAYPCICE